MTVTEVFRVAAWKSVKGMGPLTQNTEEQIESVTGEAMECLLDLRGKSAINDDGNAYWTLWHETAARSIGSKHSPKSGLLRLDGVGYPMATAILAILDPEVWPVIDRWSVDTVFGFRADGRSQTPRLWQRAVAYTAFSCHLGSSGPRFWPSAKTIHDLDQAAMRASMPERGTTPAGVIPPGWEPIGLPK
jgi:hypothetical protein